LKAVRSTSMLHSFAALILLVLSAVAACAGECNPGEIIYSEESAILCLENISRETGEGMDRGNALKLTPDPWHNPTYKLLCRDNPRKDFSRYDILEFRIRTPNPDPGDPTLQLRTYNQNSRIVGIRDYVPDGIIDDSFRMVRIPLSKLTTENWDLGNVESIVWNSDPQRRIYYVDKIVLRQTTPPALVTDGERAPVPESNTTLRLTFSKRWNDETVRLRENYTLWSSSDPSYDTPAHPSDIGLHFRVEKFTASQVPRNRFTVFVRFAEPLKRGHSYTLRVEGIADEFCNVMTTAEYSFRYDDTAQFNHNIKVNQEGYLPDGPKIGYVGGYLGDLGGGGWGVGEDGTILSWDGRDWRQASPLVGTILRGVSGTREDDIHCVGDRGVILHWNGHRWTRLDSPTNQDLAAIHFGPTGIGWTVGANGTALRYENSKWVGISTRSSSNLKSVWSGPGDTAWAVGDRATILRWDGERWLRKPAQ
jgi:hypothetical protein